MSNPITVQDLQQADAYVKARLDTIDYEVVVPESQEASMSAAALLFWRDVLDMEYQYLDSGQDEMDTLSHLVKAGVDLDAILCASEDTEVDEAYLPSTGAVSLRDFKTSLRRYALSDISSAWMTNVRQSIEDVTGTDPLDEGGLSWPDFQVLDSTDGFTIEATESD